MKLTILISASERYKQPGELATFFYFLETCKMIFLDVIILNKKTRR